MKLNKFLSRLSSIFTLRSPLVSATARIPSSDLRLYRYFRATSGVGDDSEMKELTDYLNNLKNYEKSGVPKGAGTDSEEGFDLGRMTRLMELLGNPQSNFKVRFLSSFALLFTWAPSSFCFWVVGKFFFFFGKAGVSCQLVRTSY